MTLHTVLEQFLKKAEIDVEKGPEDQAQWVQFLDELNTQFKKTDQNLTLSKKTAKITLQEVELLLEELEEGQKLFKFGHWSYFVQENRMYWSKHTYLLFERAEKTPPPSTFEETASYLHNDDKIPFLNFIQKLQNETETQSTEVRLVQNGQMRWLQCHGRCTHDTVTGEPLKMTGTYMDITQKKEQEAYMMVHAQLIYKARMAGMADVATQVLHNVGNVLNSVNTSSSYLREIITQSKVSNLPALAALFKENESLLGPFFKEHPKGKHALEFLTLLAEEWTEEQAKFLKEAAGLESHIEHIKNIIAMQQSLGHYTGTIESVTLPSILEEAILITKPEGREDPLTCIRKYAFSEAVWIDKIKVQQIVINLVKNAREAIQENPSSTHTLTIEISKKDAFIYILIQDSGSGIASQDLIHIFSHGFTTKKEGHGYGLHTSALSAQEMGGSLQASSEGPGQGATFTLKLPLHAKHTLKTAIPEG